MSRGIQSVSARGKLFSVSCYYCKRPRKVVTVPRLQDYLGTVSSGYMARVKHRKMSLAHTVDPSCT